MLKIFADSVPCVATLLIFKVVSHTKSNHLLIKRQKQLREKKITRYFPGVKDIFNENAYTCEDVIIMWIEELQQSSLNTALPSLDMLDATKFHKTAVVRALSKRTT